MKKLIPIIIAMMLLLSGCYTQSDLDLYYNKGLADAERGFADREKLIHDKAYEEGHLDGMLDAVNNTSYDTHSPWNVSDTYEILGNDNYQDGYEEGFTEGYWEGKADAIDDSKIDNEYNLEKEYIKGYKCGYEAGYYDGEEGNPYRDY